MASTLTLPLVPVELYLKTNYETSTEYVDGLLVEKLVGSRTHSRFQLLLSTYLIALEKEYGFCVYLDQHIRIASRRYRVPDVLVMPADHRREEILTEPPLVTVEVVSPGEDWAEITRKCQDHRSLGVPVVYIVDPYARTLFVVAADGLLRQIGSPLIAEIVLPGGNLRIDFEELFSRLD